MLNFLKVILVLRVWAVWKMNKLIVAASALFHAISFGVLSAKVDMMVAPLQCTAQVFSMKMPRLMLQYYRF
jgi:hypothetical protein